MNLVGEMVIAQAMVVHNPDLRGLRLPNFNQAARQLGKGTRDIQDIVMSVRMVSLTPTFHRIQRIIRTCKELNKKINSNIIGENTGDDKNIIEKILDPLMHLVRNAANHGIEYPNERVTANKQETGIITLEAKSLGNEILIVVKADGRGLIESIF